MAAARPAVVSNTAALRRDEDYLDLVASLIEEFAHSEDLQASMDAALARIAEALDADAAVMFLLDGDFDADGTRLICRSCVGPLDVLGLELPAQASVPGRVLKHNQAERVADTAIDPDFVAPQTLGIDYDIRSLICAPLGHRDERYGVIEILNPREPARRFSARDEEALSAMAAAAGFAIRNTRLTQELLAQNRLRQELELAAAVQRNLLPAAADPEAPVQGLNRPARGVSGDFFDVLPLPDGRVAFALADVSGKGMNAALIMVKAATLFRSMAKRVHEPGLLLSRIEAELCETMAFGMFVTMVVGVHDPKTHAVRIANAGHLPPLKRDADGRFEEFPALDPPLGIQCRLERNRYREQTFSIEGGCLYLYTDGVSEARGSAGEMLGVDGLKALIDANACQPPGARLAAIAGALGDDVRDDVTLLVIEDSVATAERQAARLRPPRKRRDAAQLVAQSIPAEASQLKVVRRLVEAAAREAGASVEWAQDLVLAVDEACQNIIRHGYGAARRDAAAPEAGVGETITQAIGETLGQTLAAPFGASFSRSVGRSLGGTIGQTLGRTVDGVLDGALAPFAGSAAGRRATEGDRIEVSIRRNGDGLEVELVDYAPCVNPDRCHGRALDDVKPGGLGTFFMHALTDLVQFRPPPTGAGNRLVLTKKLIGEPAPLPSPVRKSRRGAASSARSTPNTKGHENRSGKG